MPRNFVPSATALLVLALCAGAARAAAPAVPAAQPFRFDIAGGTLAHSLRELAGAIGADVVFSARNARVRTQPIQGQLNLQQALDRMLAGTGLSYRCDPAQRVVIVRDHPGEAEFAPIEVRP